jgi:3-ketosteroid 9alpha-monooxygenase subunit A
VIPRGWFELARTAELPAHEIVTLRAFDQEFVAWRTASSAAQVAHAYCTHMGAHLGYGGSIRNGQIRCPFHGHLFELDGSAVAASGRPRDPGLNLLLTKEAFGSIFVWFSRDHQSAWPMLEPSAWTVLSDCPTEVFEYELCASWLQIGENSVDIEHFPSVHSTSEVQAFTIKQNGIELEVSTVQPGLLGLGSASITTRLIGPGLSLVFGFGVPDSVVVTAVTPLAARRVRVRFQMRIRPRSTADRTTRLLRRLRLRFEHEFEQDVPIWEHMSSDINGSFEPHHPIAQYRVWASQFLESEM